MSNDVITVNQAADYAVELMRQGKSLRDALDHASHRYGTHTYVVSRELKNRGVIQ